jgi:hypothetical protein
MWPFQATAVKCEQALDTEGLMTHRRPGLLRKRADFSLLAGAGVPYCGCAGYTYMWAYLTSTPLKPS